MRGLICLCSVFAVLFLDNSIAQENWPDWRGPERNRVSSSTNLPTKWSQTENLVWKTALPSWSAGTPVVWGDRVFLTSPSAGNGANPRNDPGGPELLLLCLDKKGGKILWQQKVDEGNRVYRKHNNTTPSPVTDGKHVWVVTGTGAVAAYDFSGKQIWKRSLHDDYGPFGLNWGYGSSPLLHGGKLIVEVLHGNNTDEPSYVVAFDAATGKTLWRQERPTDAIAESPDAYTTPTLLTVNGKTQIVVSGGDYVTGHDPKTGREIWRVGGLNPDKQRDYRVVASPIVVGQMIYVPTRRKPLLALRASDSDMGTDVGVVWKWEGAAATDVPTPICDGKYFYMADDRGMVICLDAASGEVVWGPERTGLGNVSASPVLADGKIYLTNEQAVTTVLKAGPEFEVLATNELDGGFTLSSLAVADSQIFLRTGTHLYCIGE